MGEKKYLKTEILKREIIKFGDFKLPNGKRTKILYDFCQFKKNPDLILKISHLIWKKLCSVAITEQFNSVCGTPFASEIVAKILSVPKKLINIQIECERKVNLDDNPDVLHHRNIKCLVIEDFIIRGNNMVTTVKKLRERGIKVQYAVCILDYEENGEEHVLSNGIRLITLFKKADFIFEAKKLGKISDDIFCRLSKYYIYFPGFPPRYTLSVRKEIVKHPTAVRLIDIMMDKLSNLCIEFDKNFKGDLIKVIRDISAHVCAIKINWILIENSEKSMMNELISISETYNFLIFVDKKFTPKVGKAYSEFHDGKHKLSMFADMISVDAEFSQIIVKGLLRNFARDCFKCDACILRTDKALTVNKDMDEIIKSSLYLGFNYDQFIMGFICHERFDNSGEFLNFIRITSLREKNKLGTRHCFTIMDAILRGADIILVGRQITDSKDPQMQARNYKAT
ncbi:hypothetical protein HZS_403, partial [Henneguya salminicola]